MISNKIKLDPKFILLSLFFGVLIGVADSLIDAYIFQEKTFLEQLFSPDPFELYVRGLIIIIFLVFGIITSRIIYKLKLSEENKLQMIVDLQKAEEEINILKGILPICSFCKKIRDEKGEWNQLEFYISEHSEAEFSHGFCPECGKKHYPKYLKDKKLD